VTEVHVLARAASGSTPVSNVAALQTQEFYA